MMNILIPVLGFGSSGGNRVLSNLATEWVKLGHKVTFLSCENGGPVYFPTEAKIIWFNKESEIIVNPDFSERGLDSLHLTSIMRKAIKGVHEGYDVILLNHSFTVYPAILAGARKKCFYLIQLHEPEVMLDHASSLREKVTALLLWTTYYVIPKARCIVNSALYVGYKGIQTAAPIIPPGIDLDLYWAKDFHPIAGKIVFGIIGRKEPWKGTGQAVDALRLMINKGWDVSLNVAYGNLSEGMIDGIEAHVKIVMPENDKELADFYRSVDIMLALGTIQHGAPHYPVIESMACGTPVITTGYFPADEETSFIVPVNDPESVVNVVDKILREEPADISNKVAVARDKVLGLSWDCLASKMINHIQAVRHKRP